MASSSVLDLDALLAPIGDSSPTGESLRDDFSPVSPYQLIKTARNQARLAERKLMEDDQAEGVDKPDWRPILEQGRKLISEKSKDLEVAAWMIEALIRIHGFAGLRDGFRLARELCERFWEGLHPLPGEDGVAQRVAALAGLNGIEGDGTLIGPINRVPLTEGKSEGPFSRADYKQAAEIDGIADPLRQAQRIERGAVTTQQFERSARECSPAFVIDLQDDLKQAVEEFDALTSLLDERCGNAPDGEPLAPPSSNIRSTLEDCLRIVEGVAKIVLPQPEETSAGDGGHGGTGNGGESVGKRLQNRNEAFQTLLRVAQFFKDTEPHSPVSYALEQAVRWGRMPLPDLLSELIPDSTARESVFKLVGIAPPKDAGS